MTFITVTFFQNLLLLFDSSCADQWIILLDMRYVVILAFTLLTFLRKIKRLSIRDCLLQRACFIYGYGGVPLLHHSHVRILCIFIFFRNVGDDCFCCQEHRGNASSILQCGTSYFSRVNDTGFDHVYPFVRFRIEADANFFIFQRSTTTEPSRPGVFSNLPYRFF